MPAECADHLDLPGRVGEAKQDVTPEGIHDLGGNVAEWTATVFVPGDRGADVDRSPDRPMVLRGGSYAQSLMARASGRKGLPPSGIGDNLGFRCKFRSP
jgi:formylglycine-generating enzyme required for sulfatase activity